MKSINNLLEVYFPKFNPIVFLHAHPDDESFLNAGLITNLSESRQIFIIYCAASIVVNVNKTIIRQREAQKACSLIGVNSVSFLEYCEPKYDGEPGASPFWMQSDKKVSNSIMNLIDGLGVNGQLTLISYDSNGGYGNKDHIKLHTSARYLKTRMSKNIKMYESTINRNLFTNWITDSKNRLNPNQLPRTDYWVKDFGLESKEIDLYYNLTDKEIITKKESLNLHSSQIKNDLFPMNISDKDFKLLFGKEYFKIIN